MTIYMVLLIIVIIERGREGKGGAVIILSCVLTRALIKLFAGSRPDRDKLRTD